ncbi:MAG: bifunctional folylpolyglutamate synthase/dihydrofolate synthase [Gammaproteobacteria bacterium]|nr:MAG: bifunctional folylpolyglutamate synthase/dihydrofolate synthase [Gammaproteobacteria bacterium]
MDRSSSSRRSLSRFDTLQQWLHWQQSLHPDAIDLGLERVRSVSERLLSGSKPSFPVIIIAGTNGKGSTLSMMARIYRHQGYRTGSFTSPHLFRYNERICFNGKAVNDDQLCLAFEAVEQAREGVSLTYFEFSMLAALWLFGKNDVDIGLFEVGLGGRLDAVNILDADLAVVTTVDLDHQDWLGQDRERIGTEKAGIFRPSQRAVCGDPFPPESVVEAARSMGVRLYTQDQDFALAPRPDGGWEWRCSNPDYRFGLALPEQFPRHQRQNLSTALMSVVLMNQVLPLSMPAEVWSLQDIDQALPAGRFERTAHSPEVILDVAHNVQAVASLLEKIKKLEERRTLAVFSVLSDKDYRAMIALMAEVVDKWFISTVRSDRATSCEDICEALEAQHCHWQCFGSIFEAYQSAVSEAAPCDRVVVFGSFYTVAEVKYGPSLHRLY